MVELSQFMIVAGFGAILFWLRLSHREEMIKRDVARYN